MRIRFVMLMLLIANVNFAQESGLDTFLVVEHKDSALVEPYSDSLKNTPDTLIKKAKNPIEPKFDKIYLFNGDVLVVNIKKINAKEIQYKYPFNTVLMHTRREEVHKVEHSYGKIEMISNKNITENLEELTWKNIEIIYNPTEIADLVEVEKVSVRLDGKKLKESSEFLLKNAEIILAKKAFNVEASTVLVSNKYIHKAYGELPYVILEGIAYAQKN